eukprot:3158386-Pyramimonas_sp.AAC.1
MRPVRVRAAATRVSSLNADYCTSHQTPPATPGSASDLSTFKSALSPSAAFPGQGNRLPREGRTRATKRRLKDLGVVGVV